MTQTYDEMMKVLEEKGTIAEEDGAKLIKEHGPLTDEEKKNLAAAIKMKKALTKPADAKPAEPARDGEKPDEKKEEKKDEKPAEEKKEESDEVSMDDYLQALSVLDSDGASKEDKEKAQKAKDKFEGG
jgi:hypothetical protein